MPQKQQQQQQHHHRQQIEAPNLAVYVVATYSTRSTSLLWATTTASRAFGAKDADPILVHLVAGTCPKTVRHIASRVTLSFSVKNAACVATRLSRATLATPFSMSSNTALCTRKTALDDATRATVSSPTCAKQGSAASRFVI